MEELSKLVDDLYEVFSTYRDPGKDFCQYCYSEPEVQHFKRTPLRQLGPDDARTLLWESSDHWESQDVYRHYLPRMLEAMGPPSWVKDPYVEHLFDTMRALDFHSWPLAERKTVTTYLKTLEPLMSSLMAEDRVLFVAQIEDLEKLS